VDLKEYRRLFSGCDIGKRANPSQLVAGDSHSRSASQETVAKALQRILHKADQAATE
jgi:hypothetical protein